MSYASLPSLLSPYILHITEHMIEQTHHILVKEGKNITSNPLTLLMTNPSPENLSNLLKFKDTDDYRTTAVTITF